MQQLLLFFLLLLASSDALSQKVDTSFAPTFYSTGDGRRIAAAADGHYYVSGRFAAVDYHLTEVVARLTPEGLPDTGFVYDSRISHSVVELMTTQPDGRLLLGGLFIDRRGDTLGRVIRLDIDGSYDSTFQLTDPGPLRELCGLTVTTDGRVILGVDRSYYAGYGEPRFIIRRYRPDGTLDDSFRRIDLMPVDRYFSRYEPTVIDLRLDHADRLVVAGPPLTFGDHTSNMYRFDTTGQRDAAFNPTLPGDPFYLVDIAIGEDDRVAAMSELTQLYVIDSVGQQLQVIDSTGRYFSHVGYLPHPNVLLFSEDHKLITIEHGEMDVYSATGMREQYHTDVHGGIVAAAMINSRIHTVGYPRETGGYVGGGLQRIDLGTGVDTSFHTTLHTIGSVRSVISQSDKRVVAIGSFIDVNRSNRRHIVRLDRAGKNDPTFAHTDRTINDRLIGGGVELSNGRLVVGGIAGKGYGPMELLTPDGQPLNRNLLWAEEEHNWLPPTALQLAVDDQDRVFAGSNFTELSSAGNRRTLMRYEFTGLSVRPVSENLADTDMAGGDSYYRFIVQPDGGLLLFETMPGSLASSGRISRLLPKGGYDPNFDLDLPSNFFVTSVALLPEGDMIVAGYIPHASQKRDSATHSIIKLMPDGSRAAEFGGDLYGATEITHYRNSSLYEYPGVGRVISFNDDVILVYGRFHTYRGQPAHPPIALNVRTGDPVENAIPPVDGFIYNSHRTPEGELYLMGNFTTPWGGNSLLRMTGLPKLVNTQQPRQALPLSIFPNPHSGNAPLRISLPNSPRTARLTYRIFGLADGRLVDAGTIPASGSQLTLTPGRPVPAGTYLLWIADGDMHYAARLLRH